MIKYDLFLKKYSIYYYYTKPNITDDHYKLLAVEIADLE